LEAVRRELRVERPPPALLARERGLSEGARRRPHRLFQLRPPARDRERTQRLEPLLEETPDLYCFAAFHPGDADALAMAASLLEYPQILGFKLQLLVQRFPPHDERLFPLYELVMAKGKRLLLHTGTGPVGNEFVGIAPFRKLLARYPGLPATIAHMGALEYAAFGELLADHPGILLDTAFAFLPGLGFMCDLDAEFLEKHRERILYGSDFPNILFPREEDIDTLLGLGLSQAFYDAVFRDNGLRLIGQAAQIRP
jgi:predicted TIM-barrel fold metal-dependent hydrolase